MNFLYFLFIVIISLCYSYGENSWSGCCGRSARQTPYYSSEMACCPGWMHTGDKNCSTAIVERSKQNTTEGLSQEMTSEEATTMFTETTMDVKTNDDMTTISPMTTSTNTKQTTQPRLEGNDAIVERITQSKMEILSQEITTKLMTSEEATTMFTETTMDVKTNDDMTTTPPMTTSTNYKQTKQPPLDGNGKSEFDCPEEFGYFPDSTDCNKFFVCTWKDGFAVDCPPGTHWNQTITTCDMGEEC